MEIKTSTVKQVSGNGTHEDRFGLKYDFEIVMENGDTGEYSSKSQEQDKFKQGEKVTYEFYPGKYPKIKPHYDRGSKGAQPAQDNVQLYIVRQSSIKAAIDFNNIIMGDKKPTINDICQDAEYFTQYVMNGLDKLIRIEDPPQPEDYNSPSNIKSQDDLPF